MQTNSASQHFSTLPPQEYQTRQCRWNLSFPFAGHTAECRLRNSSLIWHLCYIEIANSILQIPPSPLRPGCFSPSSLPSRSSSSPFFKTALYRSLSILATPPHAQPDSLPRHPSNELTFSRSQQRAQLSGALVYWLTLSIMVGAIDVAQSR